MTAATRAIREDFGYSRTVYYDCAKTWPLILQTWGSLTPKLMPYCIANVLITIALIILLEVFGIDLTCSEFGHEFMSILVSFLVINKLAYAIGLYYEWQGYLANMNQAAIELTQLACVFTKEYSGGQYAEWRYQVARHAIVMLVSTSTVIYKGGEKKVWEGLQFTDKPLLVDFPQSFQKKFEEPRVEYPKELYVSGCSLPSDLNLRVPNRVAHHIRTTIMDHKKLKTPLDPMQEMQLMDRVKDFMDGFRNVRKYLVAPLPLPWVQLGRIFVLAYVFTLPFALLGPGLNLRGSEVVFIVFLMTYGFVGCELLFVEINDPFAVSRNDLVSLCWY
jgi:predicted membrane chloride channel (bestrophin family)